MVPDAESTRSTVTPSSSSWPKGLGTQRGGPRPVDDAGAPSGRPDIQIESNRPIGLGTAFVCDTDPVDGGMPAVSNPSFPNFAEGDQCVTNALNDFGCRFGAFGPQVPCTKKDASQNYVMISSNPPTDAVQFCYQLPLGVGFPSGDTILAVRLQDIVGNTGEVVQIVVRAP